MKRERWALGCFVVGYSVMHHSGMFGTAEVGRGTRLADWLDLATPYVVLLPLLGFLWLQRPSSRWWLVAAVGSILYVQGHGIHLSANSVGNVTDGTTTKRVRDVVHVWDEVMGHYLWYAGLAVVIAACAAAVRGRSLGIPAPVLALGGAVCGVTWSTNGLEGGTAVMSLLLALAAAGATATVVLGVYGIRHGGFPQPSSL